MSNIAIINDNSNFVPSIFGHCVNLSMIALDLGIFLRELCSLREKYLGPKQSPPISYNDLKKDGAQLSLFNYSLL